MISYVEKKYLHLWSQRHELGMVRLILVFLKNAFLAQVSTKELGTLKMCISSLEGQSENPATPLFRNKIKQNPEEPRLKGM